MFLERDPQIFLISLQTHETYLACDRISVSSVFWILLQVVELGGKEFFK